MNEINTSIGLREKLSTFTFGRIWPWFEKKITLLGGRTIAMLAVALLISMVSVIFTDNWIVSIARQNEVASQIRTNIILLNQLKENLYKAESAQRGYLYTKREIYVAPFNKALKDARDNIIKVARIINITAMPNDQLIEQKWLNEISTSLEAKATEMKLTIALAQSGKPNVAQQVLNLDEGVVQMNRFIDNTNKLIQNQIGDYNGMLAKRKSTIILARTAVVGGSLILILLVVLVIKQLLSELALKSQLQQQVAQENHIYEIKLQQQTKLLRSLALDYQADVERERQKLSRELHDELGSIFTATKMDMAWVMKKLVDTAPEVVEKLKKTSRYIDQGISYQRHIVQELHPAMLSTFGFWPALQSLIDDAAERNNWQLNLHLPDKNTQLNETISLVAYRIVQETLNNAHKYAKATAISVDMLVDAQYLKVEIEDNGIGVDMHALDGNTHGLSGMRHRVLAIGGHFEIISQPGEGVLTTALIPLDVAAM